MTPYTYKNITGYTKKQALSLIGCKQLSTVTRLIAQDKLEVVGEMPVPYMPYVKRKLLSVESVERCAENYTPRMNGTHIYQVRLSNAQLKTIQNKFTNLEFIDLTESRKIKREEL